jgi:tetratricopeptide (TPR) repeat protein
MSRPLPSFAWLVIVLALVVSSISTLQAEAFPFREFEEGDPVPDVTLQSLAEPSKTVSFSDLKGTGFIAVFWGADLPEKIKHSASVLREVESLAPFLQERNIPVLSVNAQGDGAVDINRVLKLGHSRSEVYLDRDNTAYATLGLFVLPTVLLVDRNGRAAAGFGYSRDLQERLRGAVEIMLGEKTPEQVEAELRPEMREATAEEKAARRHLDFGLVMLKRGQLEAAARELVKAVEIDPGLNGVHLQLGCIYLGLDRLNEAEEAISRAPEIDPAAPAAHCRGELLRQKGQLAEAEKELNLILAANPAHYNAVYTLGKIHEERERFEEAATAYKLAYELVQRNSVAGE